MYVFDPLYVTLVTKWVPMFILQVYLEAKVVYNFVAAINSLMKDRIFNDDGAQDRYVWLLFLILNLFSQYVYIKVT